MKWWHIALIIPVLVAVVSPLASSSPDGLEKVAENQGFLGLSQRAPFQVIADYLFPGIANEALATILAGLLGTLVLFGAVYGLAWLIKSRRTERAGQGR
ncbi:MAG: PDGLE domain-containing protein [Chloroflexota bacterium]